MQELFDIQDIDVNDMHYFTQRQARLDAFVLKLPCASLLVAELSSMGFSDYLLCYHYKVINCMDK